MPCHRLRSASGPVCAGGGTRARRCGRSKADPGGGLLHLLCGGFSRKLSGCEAYGREAAACCTCGCGLLLCGLLSGAADGFRKYAGTYADSGGLYACGRASCGHSGRYAEKERSPTQAMKEFLHTAKCKYNLLSVHTSKYFLSFQDFDPHSRMRHHMLCFLQKVVDFNAGAVPLLT